MATDTLEIVDTKDAIVEWGEGTPWGRMDDEPSDAYDAFFFYKAIFPTERSVDNAWRLMLRVRSPSGTKVTKKDKAPEHWRGWEIVYDWERRANAYDAHLRGELASTEADVLKEMVQRHESQLRILQEKGMKYIETEGFDTAAAALRAVHYSMDREQKMAGIPDVTEIVVMDSEALKERFGRLLEILAKAG